MTRRRLNPRFVALLVYALAVNALVWASTNTHRLTSGVDCVAQNQLARAAQSSIPADDRNAANDACAKACASIGTVGLLAAAEHQPTAVIVQPQSPAAKPAAPPPLRLAWHARAPPTLL